MAEKKHKSGTDRLCELLYGGTSAGHYIGGSEAKMLHDGADEITRLRDENERLRRCKAVSDKAYRDLMEEARELAQTLSERTVELEAVKGERMTLEAKSERLEAVACTCRQKLEEVPTTYVGQWYRLVPKPEEPFLEERFQQFTGPAQCRIMQAAFDIYGPICQNEQVEARDK